MILLGIYIFILFYTPLAAAAGTITRDYDANGAGLRFRLSLCTAKYA